MKLDRTDRTILAELQRDGRLSNRELAEQVHLSESACLRRVRALEEAGVIDRYAALVNQAKVGLAGQRVREHHAQSPGAGRPRRVRGGGAGACPR